MPLGRIYLVDGAGVSACSSADRHMSTHGMQESQCHSTDSGSLAPCLLVSGAARGR